MGGFKENYDVSVHFDDSIIEDRNLELTQKLQLVSAGLMLPWEFRIWYYKETEEQAKSKIINDVQDEE